MSWGFFIDNVNDDYEMNGENIWDKRVFDDKYETTQIVQNFFFFLEVIKLENFFTWRNSTIKRFSLFNMKDSEIVISLRVFFFFFLQ